ncbi:P-loop containing nucleoside triphosphate hydrolase protein [Pavlovales sp. CCMP2436]|nr:P-loop containing nucleoside triphosphate hydrolase protein [Pavlovales sp. CCMP2436]
MGSPGTGRADLSGLVDANGQPLDHFTAALQQEGITSLEQLLELPRLELLHTLRLFMEDLDIVLEAAARAGMPAICTARQMKRGASGVLPTFLPRLDRALGGGLTVGTVTEICGAAGSGKTQMCLHVTAQAVLSDAQANVVYVDTEHSFSPKRLEQMLLALAAHLQLADGAVVSALGRVHVLRPLSTAQLVEAVHAIGQLAAGPARVTLVVLDSVGALVRAEFDRDASMRRFEHLTALSASLKRVAGALGAVVVVTNQVVGLFDEAAASCGELEGQAGSKLQPSLGVTWAHNVNYRLLLQYMLRASSGARGGFRLDEAGAQSRSIRIEKSPKSAQATVPIAIELGGLVEPPLENGAAAHVGTPRPT